MNGSGSDVSDSINFIAEKYGLNKYELAICDLKVIKIPVEENVFEHCNTIRDFLGMRENVFTSNVDKKNLSEIIDNLCTI